jgi:hypothetical protein
MDNMGTLAETRNRKAVKMTRLSVAGAIGILATLLSHSAHSQDGARPPVGGVSSPADAMIFYLARGPVGACGPGCSEWIAAEGAVQWDTYKRLFALLDRLGGRKPPVVLKIWGEGNLNVATALGKIIRERGLDVTAGSTFVPHCANRTETECFALKRSGGPLEARINSSSVMCDVVCVLILAGGIHRTLPADAKVVINPMHIRNRLAPNVSAERQEGLKARFGNQFRLYLTQMGVHDELVDIIDRNSEAGHATSVRRDDWLRLRIVTALAL